MQHHALHRRTTQWSHEPHSYSHVTYHDWGGRREARYVAFLLLKDLFIPPARVYATRHAQIAHHLFRYILRFVGVVDLALEESEVSWGPHHLELRMDTAELRTLERFVVEDQKVTRARGPRVVQAGLSAKRYLAW